MRKIVILTDSINTYGGIQRCVVMLSNKLLEKNYDIHIICTNHKSKELNPFGLNNKIQVHYSKRVSIFNKIIFCFSKILEKIDLKTGLFKTRINIQKFIYFTSRYSKNNNILKIINEINPDYVIGSDGNYTMFLGIYYKKINTKIIGWQHSSCDSYFNHNFKHCINLYKNCLNKLNKYIVLTKNDKNWLKDNFNYNSICIYNFKTFNTNLISNLKNKKMISVGRLADVKNYTLLIEAYKIFYQTNKEWTLEIYGEGDDYLKIKHLIDKYDLNRNVFIHEPTPSIKEKYLESSIFIICSKNEGFPLVLIEALECGLPIIASNLPCVKEILSGNEGIILNNNTIQSLANALNTMTLDKNKLKMYSYESKKRSIMFSDNIILKKWINVLESKDV